MPKRFVTPITTVFMFFNQLLTEGPHLASCSRIFAPVVSLSCLFNDPFCRRFPATSQLVQFLFAVVQTPRTLESKWGIESHGNSFGTPELGGLKDYHPTGNCEKTQRLKRGWSTGTTDLASRQTRFLNSSTIHFKISRI